MCATIVFLPVIPPRWPKPLHVAARPAHLREEFGRCALRSISIDDNAHLDPALRRARERIGECARNHTSSKYVADEVNGRFRTRDTFEHGGKDFLTVLK